MERTKQAQSAFARIRPANLFLAGALGLAGATAGLNPARAQTTAPAAPVPAAAQPTAQVRIAADVATIDNAMTKMKGLPASTIAEALEPARQEICNNMSIGTVSAISCSPMSGNAETDVARSLGVIGVAAIKAASNPDALKVFDGAAAAVALTAGMGGVQSLQAQLPAPAPATAKTAPAPGK